MKASFYIFGTPNGFDIYQETHDANAKSYFQCFYDESVKDNARLVINRRPNGEVSYTYLKYHLYSIGNRPNAFLGLSIVFENGYYADISSLYNLLEKAYEKIIFEQKILTANQDKSSGRFVVDKFSNNTPAVKEIERFVLSSLLSDVYAADYHAIDSSFECNKGNTILKIPFKVYNDSEEERRINNLIVSKLRAYSWLSLSPDYIKKEVAVPVLIKDVSDDVFVEELDPQTKKEFETNFEDYQAKVLEYSLSTSKDSSLIKEIQSLYSKVKSSSLTLNQFASIQDGLLDLKNKYVKLATNVETLLNNLSLIGGGIDIPTGGSNDGEEIGKDDGERKKKKQFKNISIVAISAFGIIMLVTIAWIILSPVFKPESRSLNNSTASQQNQPTAEVSTEMSLEQLRSAFVQSLQNGDEDKAVEFYKEVQKKGTENSEVNDLLMFFDQIIGQRLQNYLSKNMFKDAFEYLKKLEAISINYPVLHVNTLRNSFKQYVNRNKSNNGMKEQLKKDIADAQKYGYGYDGIDGDLRTINEQQPVPSQTKDYQLAVYVERSELANSRPKSSDTIEIDIGKEYLIKNLEEESGASFGTDKELNKALGYFPTGNSHHSFKIKAPDSQSGKLFSIPYKRGNTTLFTVKIKVKDKESLEFFTPNEDEEGGN